MLSLPSGIRPFTDKWEIIGSCDYNIMCGSAQHQYKLMSPKKETVKYKYLLNLFELTQVNTS